MNDENFSLRQIEKKWQSLKKPHFSSKEDSKNKRYILEMLPYPSGKIHMGHVRNYSIGDAMARYFFLRGDHVFHPIGWDAFGLPAENAAIDQGVDPKTWTEKNIAEMRSQLKEFGFFYDWDAEIQTCAPEYYHWNQWLFREFFNRGLAYKKYAKVNYCPHCQTVLANEQVIDGRCWRCATLVVQKNLSQWYLAITKYAQPLLEQQELLRGHWPDRVLNMQKRWIGQSHGVKVEFLVRGYDRTLTVFTTKISTLFGVTFLALSTEHPWIQEILEKTSHPELESFVKESQENVFEENQEKKGVFTGFFAQHPLTQNPIPIYAANYVNDYGEGAVMGVPAHDERDFDFAKKYDLPCPVVIKTNHGDEEQKIPYTNFTSSDSLIFSEEFNELPMKDGEKAILKKLQENHQGTAHTQYKLRDWLISRQRYWGTPIPIIQCPDCGPVLVPEEDLPVLLPTDVRFEVGQNPILTSESFREAPCPQCKKMGLRETDTMDTFFDSSWYFMRYLDPQNSQAPFSKDRALSCLPVDTYIGGIEHAVLHLLYARFFYLVLGDMNLVPGKEPFQNLITQGMVLSFSYYCKECKAYYNIRQLNDNHCPQGHVDLIQKMEKMSKSKNNGVDPGELVQTYGADASRLFILFAAPVEKDLEWNEKGLVGSYRFLNRILQYTQRYSASLLSTLDVKNPSAQEEESQKILSAMHKTIAPIHLQMESFSYNGAIAKLMGFLNLLEAFHPQTKENFTVLKTVLTNFSILLFPFAPHIAQECYALIQGEGQLISANSFPSYDSSLLQEKIATYTIQWNGKMKGTLEFLVETPQKEIEERAQKLLESKKVLEKQTILKLIFVQDKIVNFVTKPL